MDSGLGCRCSCAFWYVQVLLDVKITRSCSGTSSISSLPIEGVDISMFCILGPNLNKVLEFQFAEFVNFYSWFNDQLTFLDVFCNIEA